MQVRVKKTRQNRNPASLLIQSVNSADASLAPETAMARRLDAAERHSCLVVNGGAVDMADAGIDPFGDLDLRL
jgi:hypothetical protein